MSAALRITPHFAVMVCIAAAGCQDPVLYRSESLEVRGPEDELVCAGTFAHMDKFVTSTQALLGEPFERVRYEWAPNSFDVDECPEQALGCASSYFVYAKSLASEHELFHASRSNSLPRPLEEGLATMYGEWLTADERHEREQLRTAIETNSFATNFAGYERAAHFASFLVWWQGVERIVEFQRTLEGDWYDRSFSAWVPVFEEIYGASWEDVWALYEDYPECNSIKYHQSLTLCAGPITPEATLAPELGAPAEFTVEVGCEQDTAVGPVFDDDVVRKTVVLDIQPVIALPLWAELEADEELEAIVVLTPACGDCTTPQSAIALDYSGDIEMGALSGAYVMHVFTAIDRAGSVTLRLSL